MAVESFLDDLSNWYVRRSRRRFWKSEHDSDKNTAYATLYHVLVKFIRLLAPFIPFVTEAIYQNQLEMGHDTYKFAKVLPENYDKTKTHTIGIYGTRNLTEILVKNYYANVEHDFRPDGAAITDKWDKIKDGACLNCHDPLALHGGSRRDVKLCVLCHSTQTSDPETKSSVNMAAMIHKIHAPGELSKPYIIWGNRSTIHDYSHVTFPQDIRNCANCHEGRNAAQKPTQSDLWYTKPSRRACGACHDDIDLAGGSNHPKPP